MSTRCIPDGSPPRNPGRLHFAVHGGAHTWGSGAVMTFVVNIAPDGAGRTLVNTQIDGFRTSQQTYLFVPVTPKVLEGYRSYKKFAEQMTAAVFEAC